jgi:uncharacterized protein YndB with AHSA1/START domain
MDKIEREVTINAPIKTVWGVVTDPGKWLGEEGELDVKVGGKGKVAWKSFGECPLEVIKLNEPEFLAFAWIAPDDETRSTSQKTLVEINLSEANGQTHLRLTESVYGDQLFSDDQKNSIFGKHSSGWGNFAENIKRRAEEA